MPLYVSKPSTIEAVQFTGDNIDECMAFAPGKVRAEPRREHSDNGVDVHLLAGVNGAQGWVAVPVGHWLANRPGDKNDIWPVENDYFIAKYQLAAFFDVPYREDRSDEEIASDFKARRGEPGEEHE